MHKTLNRPKTLSLEKMRVQQWHVYGLKLRRRNPCILIVSRVCKNISIKIYYNQETKEKVRTQIFF